MIPRRKCELCGEPIEPSIVRSRKRVGKSIICRACVQKEKAADFAARIERKKALFAERRCAVCGGPIKWKDSYDRKTPTHWPKTCCARCHGIYAKRNDVLTPEQCIARIEAYLKEVGHPCPHNQILHGIHMASKVLTKLHISILDVQKKFFGLDVDRVHADLTAYKKVDLPSLSEIADELQLSVDNYQDLCDAILQRHRDKELKLSKELLERVYLSYIGFKGHYVPKVVVVHELFHKNWTVEQLLKDVSSLMMNWQAGYKDPKRSWYELEAALYLRKQFGADKVSAEHTFPDCRSSKDFPLRFDFYVPEYRLLVEVDGEQHANKDNSFYTDQLAANDRIKEAYAAEHDYILVRVPTTPRFTFTSRLEQAIMDVVKPAELLEPLPDNAEGNQQPSPESNSDQFEFDF